jgi:hypothetical protein
VPSGERVEGTAFVLAFGAGGWQSRGSKPQSFRFERACRQSRRASRTRDSARPAARVFDWVPLKPVSAAPSSKPTSKPDFGEDCALAPERSLRRDHIPPRNGTQAQQQGEARPSRRADARKTLAIPATATSRVRRGEGPVPQCHQRRCGPLIIPAVGRPCGSESRDPGSCVPKGSAGACRAAARTHA